MLMHLLSLIPFLYSELYTTLQTVQRIMYHWIRAIIWDLNPSVSLRSKSSTYTWMLHPKYLLFLHTWVVAKWAVSKIADLSPQFVANGCAHLISYILQRVGMRRTISETAWDQTLGCCGCYVCHLPVLLHRAAWLGIVKVVTEVIHQNTCNKLPISIEW